MATPTGGLLAFDARGSIGKTIVYSTWRGRNYVRRHVVPGNPQTVPQMSNRHIFRFLQAVWKDLPADVQAVWTLAAKGRPLTDRNLFTSGNQKALQGEVTLAGFSFSRGAAAGVALASAVFSSTGAGNVHLVATAGALPVGWALTDFILAAIAQQDPHLGVKYATVRAIGAASPLDIAGLATDTYVVGAWGKYTKAGGEVCYGPATMGTQVVA